MLRAREDYCCRAEHCLKEECLSEVGQEAAERGIWKKGRAYSEQDLSTVRSRFDNEGRALLQGLGGEAAAIKALREDLSYANTFFDEQHAPLK